MGLRNWSKEAIHERRLLYRRMAGHNDKLAATHVLRSERKRSTEYAAFARRKIEWLNNLLALPDDNSRYAAIAISEITDAL